MERTDISIAKELLGKHDIVIAIVKDGELMFSSSKKGIQPFFDALAGSPRDHFSGCSIADRVIGKAALMLAAYFGAKEVYTPIASRHAINASLDLDLNLIFDESTEYIINRSRDGMCPMEKTVLDVDDPEEAFEALKNKLQELKLR